MKLGEPDPLILKALIIFLGVILMGVSVLFLASAMQQWRRYPGRALISLFFSVSVALISVACVYVLLS